MDAAVGIDIDPPAGMDAAAGIDAPAGMDAAVFGAPLIDACPMSSACAALIAPTTISPIQPNLIPAFAFIALPRSGYPGYSNTPLLGIHIGRMPV
ncbi:hypothetical protein [Pararobbsia silviterrae]|uniref:hypothetical protein n=1 Tax=Pararobbsia silviterrae TaxID=1792498 RepID=UPI000EABCCC3|nr:hypothetical protein [Pararobbsia silviterrae]